MYERALAALMELHLPWQGGLGQDALLQGTVQHAAGTQAPAKGASQDVGAEGAGWKDTGSTGASRPDSKFEPWFFLVVCFFGFGFFLLTWLVRGFSLFAMNKDCMKCLISGGLCRGFSVCLVRKRGGGLLFSCCHVFLQLWDKY